MPGPTAKPALRRGLSVPYNLLQTWWRHRASFAISLGITLAALALYYAVFLQENPAPGFEFVQRLELNALDTRFRYRPQRFADPDPRIVIVDIDQRSQEVLGRWPFSRAHFARLLDVLREDGAKVAAFDITFSKPDQSAAPVRALWARLDERRKRGEPVDPKLAAEVQRLAAEYDADTQFAQAIKRFGPVILGNFFLYTQADLRGMDDKTLDAYAEQLAFFSFPQVIGIREGFQRQDRVHLIQEYAGLGLLPQGAEANLALLTEALSGGLSWTGFFNAPPDPDGVVRRATLVLPFGRSKNFEDWDLYGSLDVMTARAFLGIKAEDTILRYGQTGVYSIQIGPDILIRTDDRGQIQINFRGPANTFAHYSMADVASGKFPPGTFRDKIVLIGATATGIGDLKTTPYGGSDYPGVEIHANVIDNILNQRFLKRGPKQALWDVVLILGFGIPVGIWMALVTPRWMWFNLSLLAPFAAGNFWAFLHGWWINFTVPAATLSANVLMVALYRALVEEKEKRKVRTAFGQYLSPEVIRRLLLNPRLVDPRKTEITVMFSDIRGFTTISEKLDAQELALFLNQYLSDMTRIVFQHQGTLDKYIGDAVMAFWGAPFEEDDHAVKACEAALDMMKRVRELQAQWKAQGKPPLDIGIGLNSGVASVGNMGSSLRYGYTALGDAVNLSSRLEGLNKEYGTHILVTETTYAEAKDAGFVFRELDLIQVKGKLQPVTIFELMARREEASSNGSMAELAARLEMFAAARELYRKRRWEEAQKTFQALLEKWPDDGPSRMYWKRCQEYLFEEPPANWDGVFVMTHK
jgi:adenylate cyclase